MGSFFATCSVSNMTLVDQKTSILLLVPSHSPNFVGHENMICSDNGYAQAFFSPFGFPIHGNYYDYGRIENIVIDKNVEMLEDYFGIDIDEIINNIGRKTPEGIKNEDVYKKLHMTFIRTEVLNYLEKEFSNLDNLFVKMKIEGINKFIEAIDKRCKIKEKFHNLDLSDYSKNIQTLVSQDRSDYLDYMHTFDFKEKTYISSAINMFIELPITTEFKDEIEKQHRMLYNLSKNIKKELMPSEYGSQENNWTELYKFNDFVNDILVQDIKNMASSAYYSIDDLTEDERNILNTHAMIKRDRKINSIL